jgi:nicotinate phosphoribosyltransferase
MNLLQQQILFASKAARCVLAADGKASLVDFGVRRAHGAEAGLYAARSSYIAGFAGTSTVLAEAFFGIPIFGTMAHSFVEAHEDEREAFLNFALANPGNVTLLIDTYDTLEGARKAVAVAGELRRRSIQVRAVRLDSGDLVELSRAVREILDAGGFRSIQIFASGNMDEHIIADLISRGAPIDGFGVGTKMDTSADAPYLECAYKLVEYAGTARMKKSSGKVTWPGRKQVFRQYGGESMVADTLALDGEEVGGIPLIVPVMKGGARMKPPRPLPDIVGTAREQLGALPHHLRVLGDALPYPVHVSPALRELRERVAQRVGL